LHTSVVWHLFARDNAATLANEASQLGGTDPLRSIFIRFLKFGALAWGGPAAQIAMIKRECVDEERWISEESFRKLLAVYQVLPGPEAHEPRSPSRPDQWPISSRKSRRTRTSPPGLSP
jgi:hypothetical protein